MKDIPHIEMQKLEILPTRLSAVSATTTFNVVVMWSMLFSNNRDLQRDTRN